ncbi:MAG: type IV secretory system conjugative DNA transfer family protein [Gammaproteobacteria bacterium]|nr:type IV secretory system conjugative DNA transfer family protein [Gammaproteobacteria bacterium]
MGAAIVSGVITMPIRLFQLAVLLALATIVGFLVTGVLNWLIFETLAKAPLDDLRQLAVLVFTTGCLWALAGFAWAVRNGLIDLSNATSHGSARFASKKELAALEKGDGLLIGRNPNTGRLLHYGGLAHLLTLAPTRAGKGVGTVIPNLLLAERSVLVIDPKGENARITEDARRRYGDVHVLDPFEVTGLPSSAYNPLDRLTANSPDLGEDAASLAEALVMDAPGQSGDAHWNDEAKALLSGLIMFCVCHEDADRRTLASVREYLTLPPDKLHTLMELMQDSDAASGLIARAANRFLGKAEREAASVLSGAQRHTHFLDSPRIAKVMARSDFHFADLRHRITSVFLVLPPNRMDAYSRWLRLLVSQALQDIARDAEVSATPAQTSPAVSERSQQPQKRLDGSTLFLLDEFAALGRLEAVERAMGLMAGYGMQLWPILQDMSQLKDLYGARAGTFIANAGVQQVFGVNDFETARWLSQMMGKQTTRYQTESHRDGTEVSTSHNVTGRDLMTPDEIMQLPEHIQLLRIQGQPTALAQKLRYYDEPEFTGLFEPQNQ